MTRRNPFRRHGFPREVILLAARRYCLYPILDRDVLDLLSGASPDPMALTAATTASSSASSRWITERALPNCCLPAWVCTLSMIL